MTRWKFNKKIGLALLLLGLSALASLILLSYRSSPAGVQAEKVNLALRRTAHLMLLAQGDSTSRIGPVRQTADNVWVVRLERSLDYDLLPKTLQSSFDLQQINAPYNVTILRCSDSELQLGFNSLDYSNDSSIVPCGGRDMVADCYDLQVHFYATKQQNAGWAPLAGFFLLGLATAGFLFLGSRALRKRPEAKATVANSDWLRFGNSRLHFSSQELVSGAAHHQLTYREAKLLHLFVTNPNQLLERSLILEKVWAEEGILVGRSVDVFVSRLRKLLRDDPSVGIATVHGLGYRLEIPAKNS